MEYKVVIDFIERGSLQQFKAGDTYACLDPARAKKLVSLGYISEQAAEPKQVEDAEPKKTTAKAKAPAKRSTKKKA